MSLDRWRDLRREQALRVANASRGHRDRELAAYVALDEKIKRLEQGP